MSAQHTPARRVLTMRAIRAKALADWYEREAVELRATGDCDMNNLAAEYEQHADDLSRGEA